MLQRTRSWFNGLPQFPNPIEHQQAPSLQIFLVGLAIAATLWIALPLLTAGTTLGLVFGLTAPLIVILANVYSVVLLRQGRFGLAVGLSTWTLMVAVSLVILPWGLRTAAGMTVVYALSITLSGLLTNQRSLLNIASACASVVVIFLLAEYIAPGLVGFAPLQGNPNIVTAGTFVLATGILVALFIQFSSSLRHLLQLTLERERQLDHLRASLETTVAERTLSLQQALVAVEQREEQLRHTLADLHDSQEATRELSAPVMPVLPGVLVAPLVGALDSGRAAMLQSNVLNAVQRERAHWVIFDVTGVPLVDTQVAQVLHQTTESIRLLGAQVLLVGIRPEVAQTLVALNISLDSITTYATLQEAVMRLAKSSDMGSSLAYWHK